MRVESRVFDERSLLDSVANWVGARAPGAWCRREVSNAFLDAIHLVRDVALAQRFRQDEADIIQLMTQQLPSLNLTLLGEYFALFEEQDALERFLDEARQRRG